MRAKEMLEFRRKDFNYYEHVHKSIYDLYLLRTDKRKTKKYFNKHLFADARYRKKIKINNGSHESIIFRENKDEIDRSIAYRVRLEIKNAISEDNTFIYAYNIIVRDHNPYDEDHKGNSVKLKPETLASSTEIEKVSASYKEDYPKNNLGDFLLDEVNNNFFYERFHDLKRDEEWWLTLFNRAYELFDRLRVLAYEPFRAHYLANNIYFGDKTMEDNILDLVILFTSNYAYDLSPEQKKKLEMLAGSISEFRDKEFQKIGKNYLDTFPAINLDEVNWIKATRIFNYQVIKQWVTHPDFNHHQQLQILRLIEEKYLTEKQSHPDLFCYDLSGYFSQLRQLLTKDEVKINHSDPPEESFIQTEEQTPMNITPAEIDSMNMKLNTTISRLDELIVKINDFVIQKSDEVQLIANKYNAVYENLKIMLEEQAEEYIRKGMNMPQILLLLIYLLNELGVNFNNSLKVQWARFLEKVTGKHIQNIKTELNIDFESTKTKKNLKIVGDLFRELLPKITAKIENDSI